MSEIRIRLDEKEFTSLVRGGEVKVKLKDKKSTVHLILADIGFIQMNDIVEKAMYGGVKSYREESVEVDQ